MSELSDDKTPIKYILIGDSSSMKIITEFSSGNSNPKTKKEINRIFNKVAKLPNKKYDERNKLTSKEENYYYIHQKPDLLFIVLANNKYPERLVFELISKIQEENIPTMVNDETRELNPSGRQALKDLVTKYQDQKNINKIAEIQQNVDELKVDMRENINKMVQSVDDVNKLQEKSNALRLESEDYKKNSNELKRLTWWKNCKLWIILGILLVIIIVVIIILVT